jgi:hypothetical protein
MCRSFRRCTLAQAVGKLAQERDARREARCKVAESHSYVA